MANITPEQNYIQTGETRFRAAVAESTFTRMGASINWLLDFSINKKLRMKEFLANGSFIVPSDVEFMVIEGCGGGQGGCFSVGGGPVTALGGKGAGFFKAHIQVVPAATYNVTIGAGGSALSGISGGNPGGASLINYGGNDILFFPGGGTNLFADTFGNGHTSANGNGRSIFGFYQGANSSYSNIVANGGGAGPYGNGGPGLAGQDNFEGAPFNNAAANSGAGGGSARATSGGTPTTAGTGGSGRMRLFYISRFAI